MTTPESGAPQEPQRPIYDDEGMWYVPNAQTTGEPDLGLFADVPEDAAPEPALPAMPDQAPTVGVPTPPEAQKRRFVPRTKVGKTAAGLLLAGVTVTGIGALVSSDGQDQVSSAANYVLEHRNNMTPQERVEHGIPSSAALTEISVGSTMKEAGEGMLVADAALLSIWGVGNRMKALGARRQRRQAEKAAQPEQSRRQRRAANKLAKARALVDAANSASTTSDTSSES